MFFNILLSNSYRINCKKYCENNKYAYLFFELVINKIRKKFNIFFIACEAKKSCVVHSNLSLKLIYLMIFKTFCKIIGSRS